MALKGASPGHEGEERPDRWALDDELVAVGGRWGIDPDRDLAPARRRLAATLPIDEGAVTGGPDRRLRRALRPDARLDRSCAGAAWLRPTSAPARALQWVMNGYLLTIAVLVVTAGRLGDMFGRKRVFLIGISSSRSARSSPAPPAEPGDADRRPGTAGVGAAPMLSLSLAIVCNAFPAAEQAAGARDLGGGLGDRPGDRAGCRLRADYFDWRLIFWINLPVDCPPGWVIISRRHAGVD